jgi:hypothetical protein
MKVWWMAAISMMLASTAVHAGQLAGEQPIKDTDGTTIAVLTVCSDCQSEAGKSCYSGAEAGWLAGKPCGKCLIQRNYGEAVNYPYDLQITGTLTDPDGQPVKDRFVKAFLPNGWTIRARTSEKGAFRLMLGATTDRRSREPLVTDLGARIDKQKGDNPYYAIFLLPPSYKPCAADAMTSPGPKPSDRVKPKAKKK